MQAEEEKQRPSSRSREGTSETALVQLRAMQRRSDLHAVELVMGPDDRCPLDAVYAPSHMQYDTACAYSSLSSTLSVECRATIAANTLQSNFCSLTLQSSVASPYPF